jgi:hypothetical protein
MKTITLLLTITLIGCASAQDHLIDLLNNPDLSKFKTVREAYDAGVIRALRFCVSNTPTRNTTSEGRGSMSSSLGNSTNVVLDWACPTYTVSPSNDFSVAWNKPSKAFQKIRLIVVNTNSKAAYFSTNWMDLKPDYTHPEDPFWKNRVFIVAADSTNLFDIIWDGKFVSVYSGQTVASYIPMRTLVTGSQYITNELDLLTFETALSTNWLAFTLQVPNGDGTTRSVNKESSLVLWSRYARIVSYDATNRILVSQQVILGGPIIIRDPVPIQLTNLANSWIWKYPSWNVSNFNNATLDMR